MIRKLTVHLTREQRDALLATKLFNAKDPMSLRLPDGSEANTTADPVKIEEGRSFRAKPKCDFSPKGRLRFVRSDMDGWAELLLEEYDSEKRRPKPVHFEATFGQVGSVSASNEVLLTLRDIGVEKIACWVAGYDDVAIEIYRELLGTNPTLDTPYREEVFVEDLINLDRDWYQLQRRTFETNPPVYTLEAHLTGLTNYIP